MQEKDILELISAGMRESKENERQGLEETNEKSDEPIEEDNEVDVQFQKGKELQDNLVTSQEILVESNCAEVIKSNSGK